MPYLDGHDRLLLKQIRPEPEYSGPTAYWKIVNTVAFLATCVFLGLYWG